MPTIDLPALDGRTALGFLAALGLHRVLVEERRIDARLGFSDSTATAILDSPLRSTEEIADQLHAVITATAQETAIPGISPGFPPPAGSGTDPLRRPREEYGDLVDQVACIDEKAARIWLPCLVTDLATDAKGRAALTPYCAPAGQQKIRTFFETPLTAVRKNPQHLYEALVGWRRVRDFTGEYFDHQAIQTKADHVQGDPGKGNGVPGATWLATMALPLTRLTGDGHYVTATCWHRIGRRPIMIWPLWRETHSLNAVQAILEHPSMTPANDTAWPPTVHTESWPQLGIFMACAAERQKLPGRESAGVLAPAPLQNTPQNANLT